MTSSRRRRRRVARWKPSADRIKGPHDGLAGAGTTPKAVPPNATNSNKALDSEKQVFRRGSWAGSRVFEPADQGALSASSSPEEAASMRPEKRDRKSQGPLPIRIEVVEC